MNMELFKERMCVGIDSVNNLWKINTQLMQKMMKDWTNYPPYNIVKNDDNHFTIEMGIAGFNKSDIDIILDGNNLTIKGSSSEESSEGNILFKGLAKRAFTRNFAVSNDITVKNATIINGMLRIFLDKVSLPEAEPKKIEIEDGV